MRLTTKQRAKIRATLIRYGISNFKIRSDGTVDVNGSVDLRDCHFAFLPVKFGRVNGFFDCEGCYNLKSLEGAPSKVTGLFDIGSCVSIKSLVGFNTDACLSGTIDCSWENIESGGIGLLLTGCRFLWEATGPFEIIEKYLGRPADIFECQMELIAAGYPEHAQL